MAAPNFIGIDNVKHVADQLQPNIVMGPAYFSKDELKRLGFKIITGVQFKNTAMVLNRKGGTSRRKVVGTPIESKIGYLTERVMTARIVWNRYRHNEDEFQEKPIAIEGGAKFHYPLTEEMINAIGMQIKKIYPAKRVLYVSARLFQVQYTDSVRQNTVNDFINFYQTIDVLIVDDIQEWIGADRTQQTFFHIFDHLFRNGKRIILASDRPPVDLKGMPERLLTRFACGLIAELEKPDVQLCMAILNNKIKRDGLQIPEEVVQFIAETANGSVRDLEGVINSLLAYSVVYNSRIDMRLAERVVKRAVNIDDKPLTIDDILEKVCNHFNVSVSGVNGKSRKRDMYLAQKYTKMPASRIGKLVGGRDHSTVIHSCSQIEQRMKIEKGFAEEVNSIENSFKLKA